MKQFFYITAHFLPEYVGTVFEKKHDDIYCHIDTGEEYRKRLLYDFGMGQESGFELLPELPFDDLIRLVECPSIVKPHKRNIFQKYSKQEERDYGIWRSNLYGAAAVIMQDYVKELIGFLAEKADTDYFKDQSIRRNFKCFSFSTEKTHAEGKIAAGVGTRAFEDVLNDFPEWKTVSERIIECVYGD